MMAGHLNLPRTTLNHFALEKGAPDGISMHAAAVYLLFAYLSGGDSYANYSNCIWCLKKLFLKNTKYEIQWIN